MAELAKPVGLFQRDGVYYYRRRVPKHLISKIGAAEIKESLKTSSYEQAKKARNARAVYWDARLEAAESGSGEQLKSLSFDQARQLVQAYVEKQDAARRARLTANPPDSEDQKREMLIEAEISVQDLRDPAAENAQRDIWSVTQRILAASGYDEALDGIEQPELMELVRRGLLELYRRAGARLTDDFERTHFDQFFGPSNGKTSTFGSVAQEYLAAYEQDAKFKEIDFKRIEKVRAGLRLIREIIGSETPIVAVNYDACVQFRNTLAVVPKNRTKFYGDVSVVEAINLASKDGRPGMGFETQQFHLQQLNGVLKLALKKGLIASLPSDNLTPHASKIPNDQRRQPFSTQQLVRIFSSPLYTGSKDDENNYARPGPKIWRRARFWVPLIALFSGMRPNEICQLYVEDVKCTDAGTHYFEIVDDEDDKKLKTMTSRRVFPVHSELIRIGLLAYVEQQRKAKLTRLFPELMPDKHGYYSQRLTDWFNESYLRSVGAKAQGTTFYSFRHNFRDALRHIDAPEWIVHALGGWADGKKGVSDAYGKTDWPDQLAKWVEKISYDGLDFAHLTQPKS